LDGTSPGRLGFPRGAPRRACERDRAIFLLDRGDAIFHTPT
jgi:hypothetical protein